MAFQERQKYRGQCHQSYGILGTGGTSMWHISHLPLDNIYGNARLYKSIEHFESRSSSQVNPRYEHYHNVNLYSENEFRTKSFFEARSLTIFLHLVHQGYPCIAQGS